MLDLVIGSACLFLPPNVQAGIVGGTFLFGAIRRHQRRRRLESSEKSVGHESGVTLSWSEVTCRLALKEGAERVLLDRLQGEAKPGRILAIFGPSGSGE
jgi:ABC-type glutathione transport system ATPase component